jgi:hypothetical protein
MAKTVQGPVVQLTRASMFELHSEQLASAQSILGFRAEQASKDSPEYDAIWAALEFVE